MFLGFCCWLTPIPLSVLCVSTCSDGLLDFHKMGFQFLGPRSTVLSPSDPRPSQYVIRSSFGQAGATAALGWAALGSHLQMKIWHFAMAFAT